MQFARMAGSDALPRLIRRHGVVAVVLVAGVAIEAALLLLHAVNSVTFESRLFDLRLENNVPTWFSGVQFFSAACACAYAAWTVDRRRGWWLAVALLALAFSVDEVASLHEESGRRIGEEATVLGTQPIAAVIVAAGLLRAASRLPTSRRLLIAAACVLVASQAIATAGGVSDDPTAVWVFDAGEDVTEMLVGTLLLAAAVATLERVGPRGGEPPPDAT